MAGGLGVARAVNVGERGISDEGKLGSVTNHLEVSALLLSGHGELVPDVHPIAVLTINALATNLNLNLGNDLLTREVQPTGIDAGVELGSIVGSVAHELVDLGKSHLEVGAVSKITVAANCALDTATKVSLSVESLLNRFNSKVGVTTIGHFPESDLGISRKVDVLCAISWSLKFPKRLDYILRYFIRTTLLLLYIPSNLYKSVKVPHSHLVSEHSPL